MEVNIKDKEVYMTPEVVVLEVRPEGVIASSAPGYGDGGDLI